MVYRIDPDDVGRKLIRTRDDEAIDPFTGMKYYLAPKPEPTGPPNFLIFLAIALVIVLL
ncbi:MAG: hypothetical protein ACFB8W_05960 [Elainellaceae cyanobacterium]